MKYTGSFWNKVVLMRKLWLNSGGIVCFFLFYVMFQRRRMPRSTPPPAPPRRFSCQMEGGRFASGAGEQKGRWRWGKKEGRTRVTSFTWCWLEPVRTCKRERDQPEGRKERGRTARRRKTPLIASHPSFLFGLKSLLIFFICSFTRVYQHPSPSLLQFSSPPKIKAFSFFMCVSPPLRIWGFFVLFQRDENVPEIVPQWGRKKEQLPHTRRSWINNVSDKPDVF